MKRFVVLGAGISGLSLAWFLKKKFKNEIALTILERAPRAGGWIQSVNQNGFLFELGPHSFRFADNCDATLELLSDVNLDQQIIPASPSAKRRYLYLDQKLRPLPHNIWSMLFSPFSFKMLSGIVRDLFAPVSNENDESVQFFATRRFGPRITQELIDPLTTGIYAGNIEHLSIKACFPKWYQYEKEFGSITKGMLNKKKTVEASLWRWQLQKSGLFSLLNGMESLSQALSKQLSDHLFLSTPATELIVTQRGIEVRTPQSTFQADYLFSTLPLPILADLLPNQSHQLIQALRSVSSASIVAVCLGYKRQVLKNEGFGYLNPSKENQGILGVIWDSSAFPQQNAQTEQTRLTVMMGGAHWSEIAHLPEKQILALALKAVKEQIGIAAEPEEVYIHLAKDAIPQFAVGHIERINFIQETLSEIFPRIFCAGNAVSGVSINDCIAHSKKTVDLLT